MLLKLTKVLAAVAVGVILLHGLPAFCAEGNQILPDVRLTPADGCVAGDACCASSSFLHSSPDIYTGTLDRASQVVVPEHQHASDVSAVPDTLIFRLPERDLSFLGKLTI